MAKNNILTNAVLRIFSSCSRFGPLQLRFVGTVCGPQTEKSGQCLLYAWQKCACFLSSTVPGNLISHIFRENEVCQDTEWERYFSYESIDVPEIYSGPRLTFPLSVSQVADLVEAFKNKQVCLFLYDFYPIILQL